MLLKIFSGDVGKTAVKKVLENLSNPPTYNYRKTDFVENVSFVCFENFKIGLRASVVESHLSKAAETFGFCREI